MRPSGISATRAAPLLLALALGACQRTGAPPAELPADAPKGRLRVALVQPATGPVLESISIHAQLWLLDVSPPYRFLEWQGSDLNIFVPCLSGPTGVANNYIQLEATLKFRGDSNVYTSQGAASFACRRSEDVSATIALAVLRTADVGSGDISVLYGGATCSSTTALRGDAWLAVCGSSSCDAASAAFIFSNACTGLDGAAPDFWACGNGADWTISGPLARAQFPVPLRDGTWRFGLAAFPRQLLAFVDPTLTDGDRNRRVFPTIAAPRATLSRTAGVLGTPVLEAGRTATNVALLDAPASAGVRPQALLQVEDTAAGARASYVTRFGACDVPAAGVSSWAGLHPIDVRLSGLSSAKVTLAAQAGGLPTQQAVCTAGLDAAGAAKVTCAAATPWSSP